MEQLKKLTWDEIQKLYDQEWVQLVDFDWPEGEPYPFSGVVRVHSRDRKEFYRKAGEKIPKPNASAFIFVGKTEKAPGMELNNFRKVIA